MSNKLLNNLLNMYKQAQVAKKAEEIKESAKKDYTEQYAKVKEIMKEYGYGLSDGGYIYLISKEEPKDEGFQVKFKGDRLRVELDGKLKYSGYGPEAIEDFLKGMFYAKKLSSKNTKLTKKADEDLNKEYKLLGNGLPTFDFNTKIIDFLDGINKKFDKFCVKIYGKIVCFNEIKDKKLITDKGEEFDYRDFGSGLLLKIYNKINNKQSSNSKAKAFRKQAENKEIVVTYEGTNGKEYIVKAPNGLYFNEYVDTDTQHSRGAGPFETLEKAKEMFKKHRPSAKEVIATKKQATIKHENGVYNVYSESGKCLGKGYKTKEEAQKRLKQVEYFKHKDKKAAIGYDFYGPKIMPDEAQGTFRIKYYGGPGKIDYLRKSKNGKYHWVEQTHFDYNNDKPFETTDYELAKKLVDQFGGEIETIANKQIKNKKKSFRDIIISKIAESK